jgi:hypothetical protein
MELLAKEKARAQEEDRGEDSLQHDGYGDISVEPFTPPPVGAHSSATEATTVTTTSSASAAANIALHGSSGPVDEEGDAGTTARASESPARESFFNTPLYARKPRNSFTANLPFGSSSTTATTTVSTGTGANVKMDVGDFVRCVVYHPCLQSVHWGL